MPFMLAVRVAALMALLCATVPTLAQAPGRRTARQSPSFDVVEKSIDELQRALAASEVTSRDLVDLYLARIDAYDQHRPSLNALVALNPRAREAADGPRLPGRRALSDVVEGQSRAFLPRCAPGFRGRPQLHQLGRGEG